MKDKLQEFQQKLQGFVDDLQLRRNASPFGMALFDSIHYIPNNLWDLDGAKASVYMQRKYLEAMEKTCAQEISFRYAVLFDGQQPVANACMQVFDMEGDHIGNTDTPTKGPLKKMRGKIKSLKEQVSLRLMVCGSAFATGKHGFSYLPNTDPTLVYQGLADAIYRIRRADKLHGQVAGILVKDFHAVQHAASQELKRYGYNDFSVEPNLVFQVQEDWKTFEDYLASLTSKYRSNTKSVFKKSAPLASHELTLAEIQQQEAQLHALYVAVYSKANFRLGILPEGGFAQLKEQLGDQFIIKGYFHDGALVGFLSAFQYHDTLDAHFVGLNYDVNYEFGLYQTILYDYVKLAIEHGVKILNFGRTSTEIKSGTGAVPVQQTCYIRHSNPLSNRLVSPFFDLINPPPAIETRQPFKQKKN